MSMPAERGHVSQLINNVPFHSVLEGDDRAVGATFLQQPAQGVVVKGHGSTHGIGAGGEVACRIVLQVGLLAEMVGFPDHPTQGVIAEPGGMPGCVGDTGGFVVATVSACLQSDVHIL